MKKAEAEKFGEQYEKVLLKIAALEREYWIGVHDLYMNEGLARYRADHAEANAKAHMAETIELIAKEKAKKAKMDIVIKLITTPNDELS